MHDLVGDALRGGGVVLGDVGHDGMEVFGSRLRPDYFEIHVAILFFTSSWGITRPASTSSSPRRMAARVAMCSRMSSNEDSSGSSRTASITASLLDMDPPFSSRSPTDSTPGNPGSRFLVVSVPCPGGRKPDR